MTFRAVDRLILGDVARYRYVSKETCLKLCTSVIYIESRLIQSGIAHANAVVLPTSSEE